MTIATPTNRVDVLGNGSATTFSFAPIVILDQTHLQVTLRDAAGAETVITAGAGTTNYSINTMTFPGTGSITYPASGLGVLPTGARLTIKRIVPLLQSTHLENQGAYFPTVQEAALDYACAVDQQQQEQINRTVQLAPTDPAVPVLLPTSAARANQLLGFDSSGNPIAAQPSSALVSVAMQPVVNSASTSAALTALGIPVAMQGVVGAASTSAALTALGAASVGASVAQLSNLTVFRAITTTSTPQNLCLLLGWSTLGDGGEGLFRMDSTDTTTADNAGTVIVDASARRWKRVRQNDAMNINWFGGASDPATALLAALNALPNAGGVVKIPGGTYAFSGAVTFTMKTATSSVSILGDGPDVTILNWAGGGGLTLNCAGNMNSFHLRDLTFGTGANGTGTALTISQSAANSIPAYTPCSDLTNLGFRGSDGWGATHYWGNAITITSLSNVTFQGVNISGPGGSAYSLVGVGITITGTSTATAVVYNLLGCTFNLLYKGFVYGTGTGYVQGVTISGGCNFVGCSYGLFNDTSLAALDQLAISCSQFACSVAAVALASAPNDTFITSCEFIIMVANGIGVQLSGPNFCKISGNTFRGNSSSATDGVVYVGTTNAAGHVYGNDFFNLATGVWLQALISGAKVFCNNYTTVTSSVINAGAGNSVGTISS